MMLLALTLLYFCFFVFAFFPTGLLLEEQCFGARSARIQLFLGIGLAAIFFPLLLALLLALGLSNQTVALVLRAFVLLALLIWGSRGGLKIFFEKEIILLLALVLSYLGLTLAVSAFPDLEYLSISPRLTMDLTSLPIDNMIPYNFARYILQGIDPGSINVIDVWKATDRGPLAAMNFASLALLLGLSDTGSWSAGAPGIFFVYQAFISFLNLYSLIAVWCVTRELLGPKAAGSATFVLLTGSFYFVNVLFSWPKFLMAYYIIAAIFIFQQRRASYLSGFFAAAAMLAHDSAAFSVLTLGIYLCGLLWRESHKLMSVARSALFFGLGFLTLNIPWAAYRKVVSPPSPRLIYFHLFCDTRDQLNSASFAEALSYYLDSNTPFQILSTKFYNLFFPFDLSAPFWGIEPPAHTWFLELINNIPGETFQRLIWGVGPMSLLLAFLACRKKSGEKGGEPISAYFLATFSAVLFVALLSGCAGNTASHVWASPAILGIAMAAGLGLSRAGRTISFLAALSMALSLSATTLYIHYHALIRPVLHASPIYFLTQIALLLVSFYLIVKMSDEKARAE